MKKISRYVMLVALGLYFQQAVAVPPGGGEGGRGSMMGTLVMLAAGAAACSNPGDVYAVLHDDTVKFYKPYSDEELAVMPHKVGTDDDQQWEAILGMASSSASSAAHYNRFIGDGGAYVVRILTDDCSAPWYYYGKTKDLREGEHVYLTRLTAEGFESLQGEGIAKSVKSRRDKTEELRRQEELRKEAAHKAWQIDRQRHQALKERRDHKQHRGR